jgi:hypothetical protein
MHLLFIFGLCLLAFLACPKTFKYFVGTLVGACGGMFFWGIFEIAMCCILGCNAVSWDFIGWSMLGFAFVGTVSGCVVAAKG